MGVRDQAGSFLRPGVLLSLAALLLWQILSAQIVWYIHERTVWLTALSIPLLAAMALALVRGIVAWRRKREGERAHLARPESVDRLAVGLLVLPLAIGLLVPARPLGSAAIDSQGAEGMSNVLWGSVPTLELETDTQNWTLIQWALLRARDPELRGFEGKPVSLLGFVHRNQNLPADQLLVARFVVTCCTADGTAVSFPVRYDGAAEFARDTWVEVEGHIRYVGPPGARTAIVEADQVRPVPQPARPYLYP